MDVIASTAFGIEVDSQENPNDPFVKNAKKMMETSFSSPVVGLYCKKKQVFFIIYFKMFKKKKKTKQNKYT